MKQSFASQSFVVAGGLAFVAMLGACATPPPYQEPIAVTPPSGSVAVTQAVTVLDASGSKEMAFPAAKATLESLVAAMPEGAYEASQLSFGGGRRAAAGGGSFDRATLAAAARVDDVPRPPPPPPPPLPPLRPPLCCCGQST